MIPLRKQEGVSIIAAIFIIVILAFMGLVFLTLFTTTSSTSVNELQSTQALYVAEGGKEYALQRLKDDSSYTGEANKPLGNGSFTTTVADIGGGVRRVTTTATVGSATRVVEVTAQVTIAFDQSSSRNRRDISSLKWNHRVLGVNPILIVGVSIRNNSSQTVVFPNGVTYDGIPLTRVDFLNNGTSVRVELWYLVAPPTGPNPKEVEVTLSGSANVVGGAVSLTGVDQSNPIDGIGVFNSGTSNNPSVTITTTINNAWVVDTLAAQETPGGATISATTAQTQQWNTKTTGGPPAQSAQHVLGAGSTRGPVSPAGDVTMTWGLSSSVAWAIGAVALRPGGVTLLSWREVFN